MGSSPNRTAWPSILLVITALLLIGGCGGGGAGPVDPPGNGNGDGNGDGSGDGNGDGNGDGVDYPVEWTTAELAEAIGEVESVAQSIFPAAGAPVEGRDLAGEVEAIAEALNELDEVEAVAFFPSVATAQVQLRDGTTVLIVNNRPYEGYDPGDGAAAAAAAPGGASSSGHGSAHSSAPPAVGPPSSGDAVSAAVDFGFEVAGEVTAILTDAGYQVRPLGGSLDDMRQYKNLGALYLDTHGASFMRAITITRPDGSAGVGFASPTRYALETDTSADQQGLANIRAELLGGDVVVKITSAQPVRAKLAVTESFIEKNWSFDNGVVVLHACYGGAGPFTNDGECLGECDIEVDSWDSSPVQDAILGAGADLLISFDALTNSTYGRPSILFFLDRMLGSDQFRPLNPPARPFDGSQVNAAMQEEDLLSFHRPSMLVGPIHFPGNQVNVTFHGSAVDARLAPSIERMEVTDDADEPLGRLVLHGAFGSTPGEVEVDDRSLAIESWSRDEIVAQVPFDDHAGEVRVVTPPDRVESNAVPLTEWVGTMTFSFTPGVGSLKAEAAIETRFRADVHRYRTSLASDPVDPDPIQAYISPASTGTSKGEGSHNDGGTTVRYTGEDPIRIISKAEVDGPPIQPTPFGGESLFGGKVHLDPGAGTARVCVMIQGRATIQVDPLPGEKALLLQTFLELFDSMDGGLACLDLTMNNSFSIPGGSEEHTEDGATYRLDWTEFQPVSAPDEDTPA